MRISQVRLLSFLLLLALSVPAISQDPVSSTPQAVASDSATTAQVAVALSPPPPASFNEVMDRVIQREHLFLAQMRHMRPMVETYLQDLKADKEGNAEPFKDQYFLGRLDMSDGPEDTSFVGEPGFGHRMLNHLTGLYAMHFLPLGFAQMVVLDTDFQKKYYDFTFVRREFLGEVRCLVIDVQPKENAPPGRFQGRIWVEDQDYNVVRFNGTYYPHPKSSYYLHFDSWRLNMRSGPGFPLTSTARSPTEDQLWALSAFPGADPSLGIRLEGPEQEFGVHPDSGGFSSVGKGPERCRRRRNSRSG
jgi:hypothetical protein